MPCTTGWVVLSTKIDIDQEFAYNFSKLGYSSFRYCFHQCHPLVRQMPVQSFRIKGLGTYQSQQATMFCTSPAPSRTVLKSLAISIAPGGASRFS